MERHQTLSRIAVLLLEILRWPDKFSLTRFRCDDSAERWSQNSASCGTVSSNDFDFWEGEDHFAAAIEKRLLPAENALFEVPG